ncbi:MAG: SUMF1/EgtB/PvdO family nonheme iron enzyme [Spirochaetales bacterium]|nr:SUMF1/EgtB/PvdO family nonheme iron enzyme [Spirochaetales bacterium]
MDEFEKYVNMFISSSQRGNRLSRLSEWTVKDGDKFSDLFVKGRISIMLYSYIYVEGNDYVSPFYMSTHEVTQFEYQFVMDENPSKNEGYDLPVESVNWYNAVKFCNKLSEARGYTPCYSGSGENTKCDFSADGYRLPTENEWEWAAKGGNKSKGYKYSGSDDIKEVAWYYGNSDNETHPVRQKKPNELGIYDMSGNVREWCWDIYSKNRPTNIKNYTGASPEDYRYRVYRGGSWGNWDSFLASCEVSHRYGDDPNYGILINGFRVVRSAKEHSAWDD